MDVIQYKNYQEVLQFLNPSGAETRIIWANLVNTMAVDCQYITTRVDINKMYFTSLFVQHPPKCPPWMPTTQISGKIAWYKRKQCAPKQRMAHKHHFFPLWSDRCTWQQGVYNNVCQLSQTTASTQIYFGPEHPLKWMDPSEILHRAQQWHCCALCKILKGSGD